MVQLLEFRNTTTEGENLSRFLFIMILAGLFIWLYSASLAINLDNSHKTVEQLIPVLAGCLNYSIA